MAKAASSADNAAQLKRKIAALTKELSQARSGLSEAHQREAATSEILRVIRRSPADIEPVLNTVCASAARLCDALDAVVLLRDGDRLRFAAHHGPIPYQLVEWPISRRWVAGRAVVDAAPVHVHDVTAEKDEFPDGQAMAQRMGHRSSFAVPLLRAEEAIGVIVLRRAEVRPFSDQQIALVRTFADQAVIAIENTRLFEEVQARNRDLTEALERQTATSEILRVISTSPTDLKPVLEAVARNAARLCAADDGHIWQRDGQELRRVMSWGPRPSIRHQVTISRQSVVGRAAHDRLPTHVEDLAAVFETEFPDSRVMKEGGFRTILAMPLLRQGETIGVIMIRRTEVRPFTGAQIALLRTFADQAVIAIENTRLFEEVQARNRDLSEALENQTATREVLEVISRSPAQLQPVFDAIARSARRLCHAQMCNVFRFDGELLHYAASDGLAAEAIELVRRHFPVAPGPTTAVSRSILDGCVTEIPDVRLDAEYRPIDVATIDDHRSIAAVPVLKDGQPVGAIAVARSRAGRFPQRQIELLKTFADQAVIAIENTRLFEEVQARTRELGEALEYQTATSNVLDVISRSPAQQQPVFDAIAHSATQLCKAQICNVFRFDGESLHFVASDGLSTEGIDLMRRHYPTVPGRNSAASRAILSGGVAEIPDVQLDPEYRPLDVATAGHYRSVIAVPMLKDGHSVGAIALMRSQAGHFPRRQIELLKTFADQAVIAIENTRLFDQVQARTRDLSEALDYQKAISDVLGVISRSPTDVQPVFDAILQSAVRLCEGNTGTAIRFDGELMHLAAGFNHTPEVAQALGQALPMRPDRRLMAGRAMLTRAVAQVDDALADPDYFQHVGQAGGFRSMLAVPLLSAGNPVGAIVVNRGRPGSFSTSQIDLLKAFADQAVIAIENARLFDEVQARTRELGEALEYQTATSDVLSAISRSPNELQPVLDAMLQTAGRLCESEYALFFKLGPDGRYHVAGSNNAEAELVKYVSQHPISLDRGTMVGRAALERRTIHMPDCLADPEFIGLDYQRVGQQRTMLGVPLLRDGEPIGVIVLYRTVVKPYTQRQIELVRTFADQAVIAINNVGLFEEVQARTRELTEALEYQTATSEVLGVISRSPTDLQPVLDTIVETATRLCAADQGFIVRVDGDILRVSADCGASPQMTEFWSRNVIRPGRGSITGRAVLERRTIHVADVLADPAFDLSDAQRIGRFRTVLSVPMLREGGLVGVITLQRNEVEPFTDKQIELVTTFADQAVIAIENARLFEEVQARTRDVTDALERQTATSEVLRVISGSPGDLEPVFQAMLANATRICEAGMGTLFLSEGDAFRVVALHGTPQSFTEERRRNPMFRPGPWTALGRAAATKEVVQIPDIQAVPGYFDAPAGESRPLVGILGGARTVLAVPMLKDNELIGGIIIYRQEVRPFTDKQIELVANFASQAVIAIENSRLLSALRDRTGELTRSVAEMKALSEVGQTISSTLDLTAVLNAILVHACSLADSGSGAIYVFDPARGAFDLEAGHNMGDDLVAAVRQRPIRLGEALVGQCGERRQAIQIEDLTKEAHQPLFDLHLKAGVRSLLAVPLLHQDEVVGALVVRRLRPGAFAPETIALLQAFASQSAIAIQNARLFREIEQKSEALEQASRHKSQFVANMSHELRTPLAAMLGYAELLKENIYGALPDKAIPVLGRVLSNGKHLLGLINTVLDISKIESGQFKLNLADYALATVVEAVRGATESLAASKKLAFTTEVPSGLPHGFGDEQRLTQVLLNLVGNAIKFTDAGEVRVAASAADGHFTVAVSDTGPGIPPDQLERVFEQFHQVDNSNTKTKGGTGLGLAIARQIVEMHGGRIWVESTPGHGATFRMELPVRTALVGGAA